VKTARCSFAQRIGYVTTCVLPADLLSDESDADDPSTLRADASRDGLSFIQVHRQLEDDLYLARVAASPALVANGDGYTVVLNENQLAFAEVWDVRLEWEDHRHTRKRDPQDILSHLRTHAAEIHLFPNEAAFSSLPAPASTPALSPMEVAEVSNRDVQEALLLVVQNEPSLPTQERRSRQFYLQQAFFQTMIDKLMDLLYGGQEHAQALVVKARCHLLVQLQRWHRLTRKGHLIDAVPHFSPERQEMMWRLTIGLPEMAL